MPPAEPLAELAKALDVEAGAHEQLAALLRRHRLAFVALRPGEVEAGLLALQDAGEASLRGAQQRAQLWQAATERLGLPPRARLVELAAAAGGEPGERLLRSGARARAAARTLRVENAVGRRLVDFARQSHEGLLQALLGLGQRHERTYDRHMRSVPGHAGHGRLLSGNI
jgi:hypothetical protein